MPSGAWSWRPEDGRLVLGVGLLTASHWSLELPQEPGNPLLAPQPLGFGAVHARATVERLLGGHPRVKLSAPLDYPELVAAMQQAKLILTDSGGIQEEAPALSKPVLVLRKVTERPEAVELGVAKVVGPVRSAIVSEARRLLTDRAHYARMACGGSPYGDGRAAERIRDIVLRFLRDAQAVARPRAVNSF